MRMRSAPPRSANFAEMPVPAPAPRTGRPASTSARSRASTSALVYIAFLSELGDVDRGRALPERGADEVVDEVGVGAAVLGASSLDGAVLQGRHRELAKVGHQ